MLPVSLLPMSPGHTGLTLEAAGLPNPLVNKHWFIEDTHVIAQIDGAAAIEQAGIRFRFRFTGYVATGPAVPAGGSSGALVAWGSFQSRQQIPQFILTAPASVTWQWQKEISLRVSSIPVAARREHPRRPDQIVAV